MLSLIRWLDQKVRLDKGGRDIESRGMAAAYIDLLLPLAASVVKRAFPNGKGIEWLVTGGYYRDSTILYLLLYCSRYS